MKIISLLLLFFSTLQADWLAEIRGGYFYPTSRTFQKIYHNGGIEGEIEVANFFRQNWVGWGNVNYFQRNGHSLGLHNKTTIRMIPLSAGFKYQFLPCNWASPYLGAGVTYSFLKVTNHSDFVKRHVNKSGFGFVLKSGVYFDLSNCFLLDLFFDYYYQEIRFYKPHKVDVGGLRMGLGLGYHF